MSTTIDNLQITIESNSTNAASGIAALADSLSKLKSNAAVGVVVKNLNNLSAALKGFSNAANASSAVTQVANALTALKSVGSVAGVGNSLGKLATSLKSLDSVNVDGIGPKIQSIVAAVEPLSSVKAGGLNSMVSALAKIDSVTESLSDDKIDAFAETVERLSDKLEPLSKQMATIQSGFKNINAAAHTAGNALHETSGEINTSAVNMASFIDVIQAAWQAIQGLIQGLKGVVSQAVEWDGIAARFGRGFGKNASETYAWIQKLNEEMGINIQQFMQYSSIYSTMLTGFGVAAEDAQKMALGYTELTYDIWAGYNDVYKNFADAAEAVKSAIAGEVEPIRRAGFTIVEATLEQTAANHGLEISLEKATESQKSYLRYLTLVEQAHSQNLVGTYAKELGTAEGLMRTLAQQTKSLAQAFGSLFLPILVKIVPYIQAIVELLTDAASWLAGLFGFKIQGVDWSEYNTGVGDAVEGTDNLGESLGSAASAAKELKNAAIGIDELNVISPPSASGGGGGGGSAGGSGFENLDVDSLWDETIFANIGRQVDAIKEKLEGWLPVLSVVGAALAALAVTKLLNSIGDAIAGMDKFSKVVSSIALLTVEAALVFNFADNFLEEGNFKDLLAQALVTAAGGYIMFKGWGIKGAAVGLTVSVFAQLAAITLNLADGGVQMDDPELWIQSAFTALTGAGAGALFFKKFANIGAKKGALIGLLATVSLDLAAITIGSIAANGLTVESFITGLGSVASATGLGFKVGGPTGALIGLGASLAINVVGAIVAYFSKDAEKSLKEDLESRFGTIELTGENLDVYIENITAIPRKVTIDTNVWKEETKDYEIESITVDVSAALDIYVSETDVQKRLEERIESIVKSIDAKNVKIALGINVSQSDYAANIDAFLATAQEYLDQHYLTSSIAIGILDSDSSEGLSSALATFYETSSGKLAELGTELKETVSDAFVDGEWIPDKLQEAIDLQKEIQQIIEYATQVEYRAEMQNLKLSISGTALTPESFKNVLSGAKEAIEKRLESLEEVKMSNLQVAIMQYDANIAAGKSEEVATDIYNGTVADIERAYQEGKVDVTYGTITFGLETIQEAFAKEIERAESEGWFNYKEKVQIALDDVSLTVDITDLGNGDVYTALPEMITSIAQSFKYEAVKLSKEARENLAGLLKALKPTMEDYEEIAEANRKAGVTVTEKVRDGLNDYNELAALSGDIDAIHYMVGAKFSTDSVFLNTLATAENAGKNIDASVAKGLLSNLDYVMDESGKVVIGIKDAITGETIAMTPILEENLAAMGVTLGDALGNKYQYVYNSTTGVLEAIVDSVSGEKLWVNEDLKDAGTVAGEALAEGVLEGAKGSTKATETSWRDWSLWPWNWFKQENEINSPSKIFEKGGGYLMEGLYNGVTNSPFVKKISDAWDWISGIFGGKNESEVEVDVSLQKSGWTTIASWIGKIPAVSQAVKLAKSGWSTVKKWLGNLPTLSQAIKLTKSGWSTIKKWLGNLPALSQGIKLAKSGWSTVKKWVGNIPTLSAGIKLVKSGWSSVKKWLGNLDFDLKFKLPKIGVKWGSKTVLGFKISYPNEFYTYAKGGFPDMGEFFIANEAGPEMVGKIGNRSAVVNNDQIVDAVSQGVYAAVVAAMNASNGNSAQAVNVYLDGRQITSTVEQRQRERGASIMGTQVYSYG